MSDKDMKLRLIIEAKNEADAALNDLNADMRRTGKGADDLRGSMSLMSVAAKGALAALAATVTIDAGAKVLSLADAYTLAEGKLRLVTSSGAELIAVQDQLYAIAQRTRTEYLSNVEVYARLAQNTKDLHLAQSQLLTITETLNQAFIISGATEAERSATMIQLSQAFSAGVLRGEEFNSVAEQGSRVLQLLADYTGKSRGELKAMAEDGQLTADVLTQAIMTGASKVNDEFGKMPVTVGQAGTMLKTVLSDLVSDANKATGATEGIAMAIRGIAVAIDENREGITSFFRQFNEAAAGAASGAEMMAEAGAASIDEVLTASISKVPGIKAKLRELEEEKSRLSQAPKSDRQAEDLRLVNYQLDRQKGLLKELTSSTIVTGEAGGKINIMAAALNKTTFAMQGVKTESESTMRITEEMRQKTLKYIETREQALARERDVALAGAKTEAERAAVEKKYQDELQQLHDKRGKSAESAAKKAEADAKKEQAAYQAIIDSLLPLEAAQREYAEGLAAIDKMDPTHSTDRYRQALDALNVQLDEATEKADEYAKAMRDAEQAAAESELNRQGTAIEISIAQGNLSENEALPYQIDLLEQRLKLQQDLLADMQKSAPEEINAWNSQAEAIARTTLELAGYQQRLRLQDPTESFRQGLKDYGSTTNTSLLDFYGSALPDAMDTSTESISQFFRDFGQGNAELSESWEALGETVENTVFDILQELLQLQLRMGLLSGLGVTATGGVTGGGLLSLFTGWHNGGAPSVDQPTFTRMVPLATFMSAPRFHTGLKGNEFPAILEAGESVLTEGQMAAIGKGLSGSKSQAPQFNMTVIEAPGVKAETGTSKDNDGSINIMVRMVETHLMERAARGQGLHNLMRQYGTRRGV
jgi:tape measure domain-containing protein